MNEQDRFESFIAYEPNTGCWLWTGCLNKPNGYGLFSRTGKARQVAHVYSYELHVGRVPEGLELDHRCRMRCCVNPTHLEPVTHKVNVLRGDTFQAKNARKTRCPAGHEYAGSNLFEQMTRKGLQRICRACKRVHQRAYKARVR